MLNQLRKNKTILERISAKLVTRRSGIVVAMLLLMFITSAHYAHAVNILSCTLSPFTCAVYGITVVITSIVNLLVSLFAWLVGLALQFNGHIVDSPAVQTGFGVSLAVANLGFVLGIIVIAIATILRKETYGIKQLLSKLIFMAIIVNFGLVISGAILGFSDSFTNYFVKASSPNGNYWEFTTALTTAFAPQSLLRPPPEESIIDSIINQFTLSGIFKAILNMLFSIIFSLLIAFTFAALAVLLLIRYVTLAILLILAPLAWLLWVFPKFSSHFSNWWSSFLRWAFFPAITMFFIYLAFATAAHKNDYLHNTYSTVPPSDTSQDTLATVTGAAPGLFTDVADMVILLGLVLGGLFAANKMSITGASVAMGAMSGGGKAFGTWAAKAGPRGALNLASRIAQPKPRIHAVTGAQYTPLTPWTRARGRLSQALGKAAKHDMLKSDGLVASVWGGMKKGSGLFKGKQAQDWECQNCATVGKTPHIIRSTKKPDGTCPTCGAAPSAANWKQI